MKISISFGWLFSIEWNGLYIVIYHVPGNRSGCGARIYLYGALYKKKYLPMYWCPDYFLFIQNGLSVQHVIIPRTFDSCVSSYQIWVDAKYDGAWFTFEYWSWLIWKTIIRNTTKNPLCYNYFRCLGGRRCVWWNSCEMSSTIGSYWLDSPGRWLWFAD